VGMVELLALPALAGRRDAEVATLVGVEDRGEDAGRVEVREAQPVDRAVHTDERGRVHVADNTVLLDRQVAGFLLMCGHGALGDGAGLMRRAAMAGALAPPAETAPPTPHRTVVHRRAT